ncbi:hypothetical protein GGF32_003248 [Allomyces javanicus]|nr:hypothetical protein GGF32_003248 [Allomyces javanicus]
MNGRTRSASKAASTTTTMGAPNTTTNAKKRRTDAQDAAPNMQTRNAKRQALDMPTKKHADAAPIASPIVPTVTPLTPGGHVHAPIVYPVTDPSSLDWDAGLGFGLITTAGYVRYTCRSGVWDDGAWVAGSTLPDLHIMATALHYGQACFEGLKAYRHANGKAYVFRPQANHARMARSCARALMEAPPLDKFLNAVRTCVARNMAYVPPHDKPGALYVRPFLFGSGPKLGLNESDEYTFIVTCAPVGEYYKAGGKPVKALVCGEHDRAAPKGVGSYKLAGNYAPTLLPAREAKAQGYPITLYLDPATRTYVDEFATSNFLAATKTRILTPDSNSVLESVTRMSIMQLARDHGFTPETRRIKVSELTEGTADGEAITHIAACGTAVVLTPVFRIDVPETDANGKTTLRRIVAAGWKDVVDADQEPTDAAMAAGESDPLMKLGNELRAIQKGQRADTHAWLWPESGITADE